MIDGNTVQGVIRSTFVIGPTGMVESPGYDVTAKGHVAELIGEVGALDS